MVIIGVDIGGMSIKGCAIRNNGQILGNFSLVVTKDDEQSVAIEKLGNAINEFRKTLEDYNEVVGIGVGCPGLLDVEEGNVRYWDNMEWTNLPLKAILEKVTGLPVKITNDANAATLGEAKYGAGKMYKNLIMLTLGTGVGGGIIINGELYEGHDHKGAELGHIVAVENGLPCACGRKGCLEQYASATGLMRQTREAMKKHPESLMWKLVEGDINKVSGKTAFDADKAGDSSAKEVIDQYVKYLGDGILDYCNIFRPEAVILSGGVANQGAYLNNKLTEYCRNLKWGYPGAPETVIITAVLGYQSGMIGAAALFAK